MPPKLSFEYVKEFINKQGELISTVYNNNKELLDIKCNKCLKLYKQTFDRYKRGHRCANCANKGGIASARKRYGTFLNETTRICEYCNKEYVPKRSNQKLCDEKCRILYNLSEPYRNKMKQKGYIGGIISAEQQQRRSKNEILFANYCIKYFGEDNVLCNVRYFKDKKGKYWDCDVIILSIKIAVAWQGLWHYKQITKKHNLKQVQARDEIKRNIIKQNNFKLYEIKDLGKYNPEFVEQQFNIFVHKQKFQHVLIELCKY